MNSYRTLSLVLILPLFLYLGYLLLVSFSGWDTLSAGVFLVVLFFNGLQLSPWKGRWLSLSGIWVLVALGVLSIFAFSLLGGVGLDITAGLILASPFLLESWIWQTEESPGKRIVALQLAFLDGVVLVAALNTLSGSATIVNSSSLIAAFAQVNITQVEGLLNILGLTALYPGSAGVTTFPLQGAMTAPLVVLGGLAFVGVLAPVLRPQTGTGTALPFNETQGMGRAMAYDPSLEQVGERTLGILQVQSTSKPPTYRHLPGLSAILITAATTLTFIVVSLEWPEQALLPAMGIAAAVVLLVIAMTRRALRSAPPGPTIPHPRWEGRGAPAAPPLPSGFPGAPAPG
jgi:hypothetical protein